DRKSCGGVWTIGAPSPGDDWVKPRWRDCKLAGWTDHSRECRDNVLQKSMDKDSFRLPGNRDHGRSPNPHSARSRRHLQEDDQTWRGGWKIERDLWIGSKRGQSRT